MSELQIKNNEVANNSLKISLTNVLLISGEGRNVGKTSLGCRIVKRLSSDTNVIAMKVTHHIHPLTDSLTILSQSGSLMIARESDADSGKDTSRYLKAGAHQVYYIRCEKEGLPEFVSWIKDNIPAEIPVICEARELAQYINPGFSVFIRNGCGKNEVSSHGKSEIVFNNDDPERVDLDLKWINISWEK